MGRGLIAKLGGIAVAIVIAVVIYFVQDKGQEKLAQANAPEKGQCLEMTGTPASPGHNEVDCDSAKATYKVVADDGKCATPAEVNYTISTGSDDGNVANLCLDLNASVDDCFNQGTGATFYAKVACKDASSTNGFKVVAIKKSGEKCANGTQPSDNKERNVLLCLGPPA